MSLWGYADNVRIEGNVICTVGAANVTGNLANFVEPFVGQRGADFGGNGNTASKAGNAFGQHGSAANVGTVINPGDYIFLKGTKYKIKYVGGLSDGNITSNSQFNRCNLILETNFSNASDAIGVQVRENLATIQQGPKYIANATYGSSVDSLGSPNATKRARLGNVYSIQNMKAVTSDEANIAGNQEIGIKSPGWYSARPAVTKAQGGKKFRNEVLIALSKNAFKGGGDAPDDLPSFSIRFTSQPAGVSGASFAIANIAGANVQIFSNAITNPITTEGVDSISYRWYVANAGTTSTSDAAFTRIDAATAVLGAGIHGHKGVAFTGFDSNVLVVGNTANAHANVVFCEATTTDEGGVNISTQSDIVTLNTLGYALTFDNVYSDASTEGNPYQIQIATGPKVIQQTQGTGNILYAGSVLRESGSSGSNTFGTNTIFRANATILVPGAATVTYKWLYSKSNGQPVTAFVNGGVYANAGATTNVLTIGNVSGTLASGTNRFAKQFSAIANSTIMCQASVELPPHLIAVGSNTANLRFSGTTMTANSAIVTMNVLTGGAG